MKKLINLILLSMFYLALFSQNNKTLDPPVWNGRVIRNAVSYVMPFKNTDVPVGDAVIYFEKEEGSPYIVMRYRIITFFKVESLEIIEKPDMLVKLGNGKVLKGKKERIIHGVLKDGPVIDVYFNLDNELQKQILDYGIEKVRFAYFTNNGRDIEVSKIYDAFSSDCISDEDITINAILKQIQNADIKKAKAEYESMKNSLDDRF